LVGAALVAGAPAKLRDKKFAALLVVASMAPDLDVIGFSFGVPYASAIGHRGLSHSIPFAMALSLGTLMLDRRRVRRGSSTRSGPITSEQLWRAGLVFVAVASHGVLDAATDGGLGVGFWIPFETSRYFLPWRPIPVSPIGIDAFFSSRGLEILVAEGRWIWVPTAACVVALLYLRRCPEATCHAPIT
jgi:inner membrane protein